ncbi:hypothetical protein FRC20_000422, partial [Serendipita sp. 405]
MSHDNSIHIIRPPPSSEPTSLSGLGIHPILWHAHLSLRRKRPSRSPIDCSLPKEKVASLVHRRLLSVILHRHLWTCRQLDDNVP